jgi:hypothetical protein
VKVVLLIVINKQCSHVVSEAWLNILMTLSGGGGAGPKLFCSRLSARSKSSRFLKFALNGQHTTK